MLPGLSTFFQNSQLWSRKLKGISAISFRMNINFPYLTQNMAPSCKHRIILVAKFQFNLPCTNPLCTDSESDENAIQKYLSIRYYFTHTWTNSRDFSDKNISIQRNKEAHLFFYKLCFYVEMRGSQGSRCQKGTLMVLCDIFPFLFNMPHGSGPECVRYDILDKDNLHPHQAQFDI